MFIKCNIFTTNKNSVKERHITTAYSTLHCQKYIFICSHHTVSEQNQKEIRTEGHAIII